MTSDRHRTIPENLAWGVGWGLRFGGAFAAWVFILYLFRGQAAFAKYDATLGKLIVLYLGGGSIAGAILGLCRPLLRSQLAAAIVGVLAAVPVIATAAYMMGPWNSASTFVVIVLPLFYGLVLGPILYRQAARGRSRRREREGADES